MLPPEVTIFILLLLMLSNDNDCVDKTCSKKLRVDCHPESAATEYICHKRGCIFDSSDGDPKCFFPRPKDRCTSCECENKIYCELETHSYESCVARGCTWCGEECVIAKIIHDAPCLNSKCPAMLRTECLPKEKPSRKKCHQRGCIWQPKFLSDTPSCFTPKPGPKCTSCDCAKELRYDCYPVDGVTKKKCEQRGCVWCEDDVEPTCIAMDLEGVHALDEWSECSQTCGSGTQWKYKVDCNESNIANCPKIYQTCPNLDKCSEVTCGPTEERRYKDAHGCCSASFETCGKSMSERIFGGVEAEEKDWPWAVKIFPEDGPSICGGSLISSTWVLTGAHCEQIGNPSVYIRILDVTIENGNEWTVYPGYEYRVGEPDIALLKITQQPDIELTPICMPRTEQPLFDKKCVVAGFGAVDKGGTLAAEDLMEVQINILPFEACSQSPTYEEVSIDPSRQICAGVLSGGKDSCNGDSGGGLMCQRCSSCNWYLAGIVSFGPIICGQELTPAIYTKVSYFEDWVYETTKLTKPDSPAPACD